jgi:hypothetical protein
MTKSIARLAAVTLVASALSMSVSTAAFAKNSTSLGGGVKCTWVLVSTVGNVNTYQQICRKGV